MVHTVGLIGVNGNVGSQVVPHLLRAQHAGKIKFIALVRPGRSVKCLEAAGYEQREVDLDNATSLDKGLKGINVLLIAVSVPSLTLANNVVDALHRSPDAVTFIPSQFGSLFTSKDYPRVPALEQMTGLMRMSELHAKDIGVGVTVVRAGVFNNWFFDHNLAGVDVRANKIQINSKQWKNAFPITNLEDLGAGLAEIVTRNPESIKNKEFSIVSNWVTGEEMAEVLTKIHASKTEVMDYTETDEDTLIATQPLGPVAAGYKLHWTRGPESFGYQNELKVSGRSFEQTARDSLRDWRW